MTESKRYNELIAELRDGTSNCIIQKGDEVLRFNLPGVKTLMTLLQEDPTVLQGSIVFDKVVGKGAAALMILGGVSEIYAELISQHAITLLETANIKFNYDEKVPFIENKAKSGLCPIEHISITSNEPQEIYAKIQSFLAMKN